MPQDPRYIPREQATDTNNADDNTDASTAISGDELALPQKFVTHRARSHAMLLSAAAIGVGRAAFNVCRLAGVLGNGVAHWGGSDQAKSPSESTRADLEEVLSHTQPRVRLPALARAVISAAIAEYEVENPDQGLPFGLPSVVATGLQRLLLALQLAQRNDDLSGLRSASIQLADYFGSANPVPCAEYLLLHQHTRSISRMRAVFNGAAAGADRTAAFLR